MSERSKLILVFLDFDFAFFAFFLFFFGFLSFLFLDFFVFLWVDLSVSVCWLKSVSLVFCTRENVSSQDWTSVEIGRILSWTVGCCLDFLLGGGGGGFEDFSLLSDSRFGVWSILGFGAGVWWYEVRFFTLSFS